MIGLFEAYRTAIGKKLVVALTGVVMFLFVLVHMIGNLQIYWGAEKLNAYAEFLQSAGAVLWAVRIILLLTVGLHITTTALLFFQNLGSRPIPYRIKRSREIDYAARTMILSGPIIAAFVVYHLLHFTFGCAHSDFAAGDVYHNVVSGFRIWWVAAVYVVANLLLFYHLKHGLWSWFQTLGLAHPKYNAWRKHFALLFSGLVAAGNLSMPLAVLAGWVS